MVNMTISYYAVIVFVSTVSLETLKESLRRNTCLFTATTLTCVAVSALQLILVFFLVEMFSVTTSC